MLRGMAARLVPALVMVLLATATLSGCGGSDSAVTPTTVATTTTASTDSTTPPGEVTASTDATTPPTTPPATTAAKVIMKGSAFDPASVSIKAGGVVTWENQDGTRHDVAADDGTFKTTAFGKGSSFSFMFAEPGTYAYSCTLHPDMKGVVIVQ
jgi:plastocyanin